MIPNIIPVFTNPRHAGERAHELKVRNCAGVTFTPGFEVGAAEGVSEMAVLGIAPTLCARLSSKAAAGEILISEDM